MDAASKVIGARCGIVQECAPLVGRDGLTGVHIFVARGPLRMAGWSLPAPLHGTGVSLCSEAARMAAVAETMESYCSMAPAPRRFLMRSSFKDLPGAAVRPTTVACLSRRQYRCLQDLDPLTETKVVDWCWAYSLTGRRAMLVPAGLVYFEQARHSPNNFAPETVSGGFACHISVPHAAISGLCEVIERDALAISWHSQLPLTPLQVAGTAVEDLFSGPWADNGLECRLFQVPTDAPFPVVLAHTRHAGAPPHAVVGVACRPDPVAAALKAVYESCQAYVRLRGGKAPYARQPGQPDDNAALYATAAGAQLLEDNLVVSPITKRLAKVPSASTGSVLADLAIGVEALSALGLEVLTSEVTTVDAAAAGYRVLRVLVPGTLSTNTDSRFAPFGAARLYELPVRLGFRRQALSEGQLNTLPVPLA